MKRPCDVLAVIPARGGSKRISRKNIRSFLGLPVLGYSVKAALDSGCFSEIMVSTDDKKTAAIARRCGAQVPFLRSRKTSGDKATTAEAVLEVLREYARRGRHFRYVCCIYPAAPFVTGALLRRGFSMLKSGKADSVVPVVRYGHPIQRAFAIKGGVLKMLRPANRDVRSQDLEPSFHDAGQFYWMNTVPLLSSGTFLGRRTLPIEVQESAVQDIDTESDWLMAELKYRAFTKVRGRNAPGRPSSRK